MFTGPDIWEGEARKASGTVIEPSKLSCRGREMTALTPRLNCRRLHHKQVPAALQLLELLQGISGLLDPAAMPAGAGRVPCLPTLSSPHKIHCLTALFSDTPTLHLARLVLIHLQSPTLRCSQAHTSLTPASVAVKPAFLCPLHRLLLLPQPCQRARVQSASLQVRPGRPQSAEQQPSKGSE